MELNPAQLAEFNARMARLTERASDVEAVQTLAAAIPAAAVYWAAFRHWDKGAPVYVLGPRLQEMFTRTALDAVRPDDLRMPFDTIYIALPDCDLTLWGGRQRHRVHGMFVQGLRASDGGHQFSESDLDGLHLIAVGEDLTGDEYLGDDVVRTIPVPLNGGDIEGACVPKDPLYDSLNSRGVHADKDAETTTLLVRMAINALLYLVTDLPSEETDESRERQRRRRELLKDAERRKGGKARKARRRASRLSPVSVVWLGRGVEEPVSNGGTHASPRQHWVKGHWHAYWHGPRKAMRKLNWVRPFLRGDPVRGETKTRIYQTEE
jgi:hypothetical protein